jgi:hypothetical protein
MKAFTNAVVLCLLCSCLPKIEKKGQFILPELILPTHFELKLPTARYLFPVYIDSINRFRTGMPLPEFVFNNQWDYENIWFTDEGVLSLRKELMDSTSNTAFLTTIISSYDLRLHSTIQAAEVPARGLLEIIPYKEVSMYDMTKNRLQHMQAM